MSTSREEADLSLARLMLDIKECEWELEREGQGDGKGQGAGKGDNEIEGEAKAESESESESGSESGEGVRDAEPRRSLREFRQLTMAGCDAFELHERFDAESCAGALVWFVSVRPLWDAPVEDVWTLRYGMFLDALLQLAGEPPNAISRLRSSAERHLRVDLHLLEMGTTPRSAAELAIIGREGKIEAFCENGEEKSA